MGTWPFNVYPEDKDFFEEWNYKPKENEPAQPSGRMTAARVTGRLARGLIKEPFEWGGEVMDRAYQGKATMQDAIGAALMAMPPMRGGGLGVGPRIKAMPWQSRTLDAILGNSQAGKKFPEAANPQTWLSKLKGAGLPKEEVGVVEDFLSTAEPRSKLNRQQIAGAVDESKGSGAALVSSKNKSEAAYEYLSSGGKRTDPEYGQLVSDWADASTKERIAGSKLPSLGITKTVLGGEEWRVGQDRLNALPGLIADARRVHKADVASNIPRYSPEFRESYGKLHALLTEQMELATAAAGKRPRWTQYQLEGVENSREILYHGKSPSGESYTALKAETHFPDKAENLAWHQFEGDLKMPEGKMSTHISGQQSEWIAERAQADLEIKQYKKENPGALVETHIPEPPMKENWYKAGLKDSVNRAVEAGHDYLSWDTAETMSKRWPDPNEKTHKFFQEHYDQKMGKFLEKEYGVKPERVKVGSKSEKAVELPASEFDDFTDIDRTFSRSGFDIQFSDEIGNWQISHRDIDGGIEADWNTFSTRREAENFLKEHEAGNKQHEVWRIPITEEMKRKVLLEGQYWSKKGQVAKPGGKDAQMAA